MGKPDFSEERIARVLSWPEKDQQQWLYEEFNSLPHADRKRYMRELDEEENTFSQTNQRKRKKAYAKYLRKKYGRQRNR